MGRCTKSYLPLIFYIYIIREEGTSIVLIRYLHQADSDFFECLFLNLFALVYLICTRYCQNVNKKHTCINMFFNLFLIAVHIIVTSFKHT